MGAVCMIVAQISQKRTPDLLELELQMLLNYHMHAGKQTSSSTKATNALNHRANSPTLNISLLIES